MTSTLRRGLVLALVTAGWLSLSAWVLLAGPDGATDRPAVVRGSSPAEEPPPPRGLWDRLGFAIADWKNQALPGPSSHLQACRQRLGVPAWHQAGFRGKGAKVAILDSGFRGYRGALGKVLPAAVKVKSFRRDGQLEARDSQHGILCGEVIHTLAPDAELLLANWEPEQPEQFLRAVRWARREGAQVISCAIIMPTWSDGEGGGPVHARLRAELGTGNGPGDGLLFASAGNTAQRHWGGYYRPGKDGWHQWVAGKKDNAIRPYSREPVSVEVVGAGEGCYEVVVLDASNQREVVRARTQPRQGYFAAAARFVPRPGQRYAVRLRRLAGEGPAGRLHLSVLGGRLGHAIAAGSIPFPGDGGEVAAVAAVDGRGRRLSYSSCGPNGRRATPELSAVVPFPSAWRPGQPFAGTSAAAPQAAALAALLWSRHPGWTANQVREALRKAARRTGAGHSSETGHGVVQLPRVGD